MSTRKNCVPSEPIVRAAVEQLLRPALKQVAKEGRIDLQATVFVMGEKEVVAQCDLEENVHGNCSVRGQIRLNFRETSDCDRFIVYAEAIFDNPRSANGFSGFSLKGQIWCNEQIKSKRTGWTIRYNVWDWAGW